MRTKAEIRERLECMARENHALIKTLSDRADLTAYAHLVREGKIWTDALQAALREHEIVHIPSGLYLMDGSVTIPSNRRIEADEGAVIRLMEGVRVLLLRNEHTQDGTHAPISRENRDVNISICGGRWEESGTKRAGYGKTGMYDMERSFFGVSTLMLFNNMDHLTLENMTFCRTAGFAVQLGDISDADIENIEFIECFADGIHANGNTENLIARNIRGQVGDDLVALNMYDWQNSSVSFGPMKTVLCENLEAAPGKGYKMMRIEPGVYTYADGTEVDCSLTDAVISSVRGVKAFKLYYQTPAYNVDTEQPEKGGVGSCDNLFFEDIESDLQTPAEGFKPYIESDPVAGSFAAFEINANIGRISFENIRLTLSPLFPMSFLIAAGPKSVRAGEDGKIEIFDPYAGCEVGTISLRDIEINGRAPEDITPFIHEIVFDRLYEDAPSTARGRIHQIEYQRPCL